MKTSVQVTASALIQDTIKTHGLAWASKYYAKKGVPLWQFVILAGLKPRGLV